MDSFMMEYDIHTLLDLLTLGATGTVIYCMTNTEMRATYQKEQDSLKFFMVVSTHFDAGSRMFAADWPPEGPNQGLPESCPGRSSHMLRFG